jgi:hypothetical protein
MLRRHQKNALVSPDLAVVQFPAFAIEALRERVTFSSVPDTPTPSLVRDAAVNVFTILQHSPIRLVGMNTADHVELPGDGWDQVRQVLAPPEPWGQVLPDSDVASMVVRAPRLDALAGHVQISVEPSVVLDGGAWVSYNSHVDLGDDLIGARPAIAVLEEHWEEAMAQSRGIAESIRGLV